MSHFAKVKSVRCIPAPKRVYNLSVARNRNYFAEKVLVHNCDDPHNIKEGESDLKREAVLTWWDESMSTRGNSPDSAKVIIMQRVHERDLSGHVLEEKEGYVHLCLPARYEGNRIKTVLPLDGPPFEDPRKEEGEPLWKAMYDNEALTNLEKEMTEYAIAGQLQQRPSPRGGGMFKEEDFRIIKAYNPVWIEKKIRYIDKASTQDGGAWTAGTLMAKVKAEKFGLDFNFIVLDCTRGQWSSGKRNQIIKEMAQNDGKDVEIWVEQEPGSGGKESAEFTIKDLAGFNVHAERVTGDKVTRADPYAAQVEIRNIALLDGKWVRDFINEHTKFPTGKYKDQVDSAAGAFNKLNANVKKAGVWGKR
jgi:predicted phage terminase large subunit-like protein